MLLYRCLASGNIEGDLNALPGRVISRFIPFKILDAFRTMQSLPSSISKDIESLIVLVEKSSQGLDIR